MNAESIKVLIIDDDEDDYILTRELLSEVRVGNYAIDWASSYEEGLELASQREHHVCLVDFRLGEPEWGGADSRGPRISAHHTDDPAYTKDAWAQVWTIILSKPVTSDVLRVMLER